MDWSKLERKVNYIRSLYTEKGISLPPDGGLAKALVEAEQLALGEHLPGPPSRNQLLGTAHDAHVIWALAENLEVCEEAGLDLSAHLAQITTGSTDFGTRDAGTGRTIFYKDFECEITIAATLLRAGLKPQFALESNSPLGELHLDDVWVEVKHPNSTGQLKKNLKKFQKQLASNTVYGVFVVGLEDAFDFGDTTEFLDPIEFSDWQEAKRAEMDRFGRDFLRFAARCPNILGTVQTSTKVETVGEVSRLRRLGNSCYFDHREGVRLQASQAALKICQVFAASPVLYSSLGL